MFLLLHFPYSYFYSKLTSCQFLTSLLHHSTSLSLQTENTCSLANPILIYSLPHTELQTSSTIAGSLVECMQRGQSGLKIWGSWIRVNKISIFLGKFN